MPCTLLACIACIEDGSKTRLKLCPHCGQHLVAAEYANHEKLYLHDGIWKKTKWRILSVIRHLTKTNISANPLPEKQAAVQDMRAETATTIPGLIQKKASLKIHKPPRKVKSFDKVEISGPLPSFRRYLVTQKPLAPVHDMRAETATTIPGLVQQKASVKTHQHPRKVKSFDKVEISGPLPSFRRYLVTQKPLAPVHDMPAETATTIPGLVQQKASVKTHQHPRKVKPAVHETLDQNNEQTFQYRQRRDDPDQIYMQLPDIVKSGATLEPPAPTAEVPDLSPPRESCTDHESDVANFGRNANTATVQPQFPISQDYVLSPDNVPVHVHVPANPSERPVKKMGFSTDIDADKDYSTDANDDSFIPTHPRPAPSYTQQPDNCAPPSGYLSRLSHLLTAINDICY